MKEATTLPHVGEKQAATLTSNTVRGTLQRFYGSAERAVGQDAGRLTAR